MDGPRDVIKIRVHSSSPTIVKNHLSRIFIKKTFGKSLTITRRFDTCVNIKITSFTFYFSKNHC